MSDDSVQLLAAVRPRERQPSTRTSTVVHHTDPTVGVEVEVAQIDLDPVPQNPTEIAEVPEQLVSESANTSAEAATPPPVTPPPNVGRESTATGMVSPGHSTASLMPTRLRGGLGGAGSSSSSSNTSRNPSPSTSNRSPPPSRVTLTMTSASSLLATSAVPISVNYGGMPQPTTLSVASVHSERSAATQFATHSPQSATASTTNSPLRRSHLHFDCFAEMLENPFLSDVQLRTSDDRIIPAHKVVLAAISPTFKTMLSGHQLFSEQHSGIIDVPYNYGEGGFKLVLQYIYTGTISGFEPRMAVPLLEASSYFQLDDLRSLAVEALCQATTEANVFDRLDLALSYSCAGLREHALMIIRQYNTEVIHSADWLSLPLDVALLLVQETVIAGELAILQRCFEWCLANTPSRLEETLTKFLKYVDFTAMTEAEVSIVESMHCVPVEILYDAFKRSVLALPPAHIPRNGGIVLQWEMKTDQTDVEVVNNHVTKISSDYIPKTVCAINKFSNGRHYWTVKVMDLRLPHDSFVGVMFRPPAHNARNTVFSVASSPASIPSTSSYSATSPNAPSCEAFVFEPCCMSLRAPDGFAITKEPSASASILIDRWCEVGVLLDFSENSIQWFNHRTKALLFTLRCPEGCPLPSPLYPCVTLTHKSNGGAMLSECTTYPAQRPPRGGFVGPTSVTPIKSGTRATSSTLHLHGSMGPRSASSQGPSHTGRGQGLASVPPSASRLTSASSSVLVSAGTMM